MNNQINRIVYSAAILFLSSAWLFIGCKSNEEKIEDQNSDMVTDTTTVTETVTTSTATSDWVAYKESTEQTINNNDQRIKELKEKIQKPGMKNLDKLRQQRIDALQEQNSKLRTRIVEYKPEEAKSDWEKFKAEVKQELDTIEQRFKDLDN